MPARGIATCALVMVCGGAAAFNGHFPGGSVWTRHARSHCALVHQPPRPHCRTRMALCTRHRARTAVLATRVSSYQDDDVFYGDLSAAATPEPAPAAPTAARDGAVAGNFSALGLDPALQRACALQGWLGPTSIQTSVIPPLLAGRDVWAEAETGSGKTAAFALPLIQLLSSQASEPRRASGRSVLALVLSPTRELVLQTARRVLTPLARSLETRDSVGLRVCAIYGGVPIEPQLEDLKEGVDVLVATPGRLLDVLMREETLGGGGGGNSVAWLSLQEVKVVVLDEADRLLAPAFAKEMDELLQRLLFRSEVREVDERSMAPLPASRDAQLCLFSATFPYKTRAAARQLFRGRVPVVIGPSSPAVQENETVPEVGGRGRYAGGAVAGAVQQKGILVDARDRTMLLRHLAETQNWKTVLVFVASQYATEHVTKKLAAKGLRVAALHGGLTQEERMSRLLAFESGSLQILVATDVAARGLDVRGLSAVVNYVGRTGRAGQLGEAVSFITCDNAAHFALIEKRQGAGAEVARVVVSGFEPKDVPSPTPVGGGRLGRGGGDGGFVEGLVPGVQHSPLGLAHDRMHGGVKGRKKSKKDKLREAAAAAAATTTTSQRQGGGNVH